MSICTQEIQLILLMSIDRSRQKRQLVVLQMLIMKMLILCIKQCFFYLNSSQPREVSNPNQTSTGKGGILQAQSATHPHRPKSWYSTRWWLSVWQCPGQFIGWHVWRWRGEQTWILVVNNCYHGYFLLPSSVTYRNSRKLGINIHSKIGSNVWELPNVWENIL